MSTFCRMIGKLTLCLVPLLLAALPAEGRPIAGQFPPKTDCACSACTCACSSCNESIACGCALSNSEGNLRDRYRAGITVKSAFGPTLDFTLTYNSMAADGSQSRTNTVMGYGWTHSYNVLLFSQLGHMFRMDGEGRVTKYKLGPGGTYTATTGYFETLVKKTDGSFTLRQKDGTTFDFVVGTNSIIGGMPFLVQGPVYRLTKITDRNNNVTMLSYSAGKLMMITDTYKRSLALGYTGNLLTTVTDPLYPMREPTRFSYDASGTLLTIITDPEGHSVRYSYNELAQITKKIDKDERVFTFDYVNQKPVAIRDGAGNTILTLSNLNNWATDETALARDLMRIYQQPSTTTKSDGNGKLWRYDYDSHGYLMQVVAPDGAPTSYTYDPATLQVATVTDANIHTTSYQYDSQGNVIQKTDARGNVTKYEYESVFNQMTKMTDANDRMTLHQIDPANGNRLVETDALGQTRQWTYDSHGNVLTETDKRIPHNTTFHVYDAFGNRIQTTDREGHDWVMTYNAVGNLITRKDPLLHITKYEYDGLNRLTKETKPLGDPLEANAQYSYDGQGNRRKVIDRNTNPTTYDYDLRQRIVSITDAQQPTPKTITYTYDGNDNRVTATDKNRHTTTFQYDVQNRLVNITDAEKNSSSMTYDPVGNKLNDTDANIHTTFYTYDELNRLKTRTDAEGFVTTLEYDMVGTAICAECTGPTKGSSLVTKQTGGNGNVTYFTYDDLDRRVRQIRKQGCGAPPHQLPLCPFMIDPANDAVTMYTYDPNNNRLTLKEPNFNITSYEYDKLDRQTKMTNAAGDMTLTSYDPDGNVKTVTAPNLNITTDTYDALDRLTQVNDSVGLMAKYRYDPVGNRLTQRDGNGNGTDNTYDTIYRLTDVTDALGKTTHYDYDAVGNLLKTTDRELHVTIYDYDKINRRSQMTDALGNVTQYQYDGVGNLKRIQITDIVNGRVEPTDYAYDKINRVTEETYPDGKMRFFAYDAVNLISRKDQKNQVTNYTYSDLYFLLTRDYPGSDHDDFMTYDLSGRLLRACRGGLPESCFGGWLVTFDYDGANRVLSTTQNTKPVAYFYDIPGRKRTITYPGGRTIVENTDARTRLDTIVDPSSPRPLVQYSYDLGNRVLARTYRNGTTTSYAYNNNNWTTNVAHIVAGGNCSLPPPNGCIAGFNYDDVNHQGFDNEGNKRFEQKLADGAGSDTRSEAYQYDKIYRLIDYKVGTLIGSTVLMLSTQTHYDLDGLGNWDKKIKDGTIETRTHNLVNEITAINLTPPSTTELLSYDDNSNLTEDGRYRYAYDEENRLTAVTRKSHSVVVGRYAYDALGRRIVKIANPAGTSMTTGYFYEDARIVEEQDGVGVTQATYVYGNYVDEALTMERGGNPYYYHQNALWSVEAVTDAGGNVLERYAYDAYGQPTVYNGAGTALAPNGSAIGNPWMFTGRQLDEETGLYSYRARYYDPVKGRFLQRDPLEYFDGMNLYEYIRSNPTNRVDPTGLIETRAECLARIEKELGACRDAAYARDAARTAPLEKRIDELEAQIVQNALNAVAAVRTPNVGGSVAEGIGGLSFDPGNPAYAVAGATAGLVVTATQAAGDFAPVNATNRVLQGMVHQFMAALELAEKAFKADLKACYKKYADDLKNCPCK